MLTIKEKIQSASEKLDILQKCLLQIRIEEFQHQIQLQNISAENAQLNILKDELIKKKEVQLKMAEKEIEILLQKEETSQAHLRQDIEKLELVLELHKNDVIAAVEKFFQIQKLSAKSESELKAQQNEYSLLKQELENSEHLLEKFETKEAKRNQLLKKLLEDYSKALKNIHKTYNDSLEISRKMQAEIDHFAVCQERRWLMEASLLTISKCAIRSRDLQTSPKPPNNDIILDFVSLCEEESSLQREVDALRRQREDIVTTLQVSRRILQSDTKLSK